MDADVEVGEAGEKLFFFELVVQLFGVDIVDSYFLLLLI